MATRRNLTILADAAQYDGSSAAGARLVRVPRLPPSSRFEVHADLFA